MKKSIYSKLGLTKRMFVALSIVAIVGLSAVFAGVAISGQFSMNAPAPQGDFGNIWDMNVGAPAIGTGPAEGLVEGAGEVASCTGTSTPVKRGTIVVNGITQYTDYCADADGNPITGNPILGGGQIGDDKIGGQIDGQIGGGEDDFPPGGMLIEYYCNGNSKASKEVNCPKVYTENHVCKDGACINEGYQDDAPNNQNGGGIEEGDDAKQGVDTPMREKVWTEFKKGEVKEVGTDALGIRFSMAKDINEPRKAKVSWVEKIGIELPAAGVAQLDIALIYINVDTTVEDDAIDQAELYFGFTDAYLATYPGTDPATIKLAHFNEETKKWEPLSASGYRLPEEDNTLIPVEGVENYFMGQTSGFSYFAVYIDEAADDDNGDGTGDGDNGGSSSGGGSTPASTYVKSSLGKAATTSGTNNYAGTTGIGTSSGGDEEGMDWWIWALIAGGGVLLVGVLIVVFYFALRKKPGVAKKAK